MKAGRRPLCNTIGGMTKQSDRKDRDESPGQAAGAAGSRAADGQAPATGAAAAPDTTETPDLSLIAPAFDEQDNIVPFYEAAFSEADARGKSLELVFVDDGSSDATAARMREVVARAAEKRRSVRAVLLSRNFGKEAAMYAGLERARGEHLCFIDADLQQSPATAFDMLEELEGADGVDCVAACQRKRRQSRLVSWFSRRFYGVFSSASDMDVIDGASDFRVFTRPVAEALLSMPERLRFSKGLFAWIGFKTLAHPYDPDERNAGKTSWSFAKLTRYALDGMLSFSTSPLRVAALLGFVMALVAFIYLAIVVVQRIAFGASMPGYATIVALILLLGGVQLLVMGIMGEYLARVYIQGKDRPIYIARAEFDSAGTGGDPQLGRSA